MISRKALDVKRSLQKEIVDPDISLTEERRQWDAYAEQLPIPEEVVTVPETLAGTNCLWLYPRDSKPSVTILYAHGGGYTAGSVTTHRSFCAELALATNSAVLLIDYRLLPESELSVPSDDFISVYLHLASSGVYKNSPVLFAGDSSGGALAITALTRLRDNGNQLPRGCFVFSGAFDATLSSDSMQRNNKSDPILSLAVLQHWQSHFSEHFDFSNALISPLYANLSNLPPTLLLAGENEVWLDDTTRMHAALTAANSPCEMHIYEGMWHVWPMTNDIPETDEAFEVVSAFIAANSAA